MEHFLHINALQLCPCQLFVLFLQHELPSSNPPAGIIGHVFLLFAAVLSIKTQLGDRSQSDLTGTFVVDCGQ